VKGKTVGYLNNLRDTSYEIAKSKGWHDEDTARATFGDRCALMSSELTEALEEYRVSRAPTEIYFVGKDSAEYSPVAKEELLAMARDGMKPEGIPIELADVCIRIGDAAGRYGLDLERVVKAQLELEGDDIASLELDTEECEEWSFGDWLMEAHKTITYAWVERTSDGRPSDESSVELIRCVMVIRSMAAKYGMDLDAAIEIKHAFNRTRPFRHGGKKI
jgi:hypothetical protein